MAFLQTGRSCFAPSEIASFTSGLGEMNTWPEGIQGTTVANYLMGTVFEIKYKNSLLAFGFICTYDGDDSKENLYYFP